jgi:hypothetical protein
MMPPRGGPASCEQSLAVVPAEAFELRFDSRASQREGTLIERCALEKRDRRIRIAFQRMGPRGVVPRKWLLGAKPHATIEPLDGDAKRGLRLARLPERKECSPGC